jgi:hypothetical protein
MINFPRQQRNTNYLNYETFEMLKIKVLFRLSKRIHQEQDARKGETDENKK